MENLSLEQVKAMITEWIEADIAPLRQQLAELKAEKIKNNLTPQENEN